MQTPVKIVLAVVVLAGVGSGGFAVFEHFDRQELVAAAERSCGSVDAPKAGATLPSGFALPSGQTLLRVETQGKTTLVVASAVGQRGDIVKVRDGIVTAMVADGYTKAGADAEPGYEADAQLSGKGEGSIKVRPLCTDRLEVRYTLRG